MAKVIASPFGLPRGRVSRSEQYPWSDWFNYECWELEEGIDFVEPKAQFQSIAHGVARLWQIRPEYGQRLVTRTKRGGTTVWLQVFKIE